MLRAAVFDFDGVIANSEPLHYQGFRDVLRQAGLDLPEREYYERYLGYDDIGVFKAIADERGARWSDTQIAELVAAKAVILERLEAADSILFPGAENAIRRLAADLPLAIASGALGAEIRRILARRGLLSCFKAIVAAEDTASSKPAPDPYLHAVALLGAAADVPLRPAECVAIEDSAWGLQSARAAGLRTIAVTHTYDRAVLDADLVIGSLDELLVETMQRLCAV